jgi:hypothetical protein
MYKMQKVGHMQRRPSASNKQKRMESRIFFLYKMNKDTKGEENEEVLR